MYLSLLLVVLALLLAPVTASGAADVDFGTSGVPKALAKTRDYDRIFSGLKAAGIDVFFPTFQTQEAPTVKTLGLETDFLAPCSSDSPAFRAMRENGIRLLIPGELLYPGEGDFAPLDSDPLRALLECAGREGVYGVLNFDEPAHNGKDSSLSQRLYERVKQVDPSVPVIMVHAPIILDQDKHKTAEGRQAYLDEVARQSVFSDIVGFDVYPVPQEVAWIGSPTSGDQTVDHARGVKDYMDWIRQNVPGKKYFIVLQGFSYKDQYQPFYFTLFGQHIADVVRPPTREETLEMARIGIENGASFVIWWGTSMLADEEDGPMAGDPRRAARTRPRAIV